MKTLPVSVLRERLGEARGFAAPVAAAQAGKAIQNDLEGPFLLRWNELYPDLPLVREHRFHLQRRWRFDFCHVAAKVGIEIEGGIWVDGAHTRGQHYESDCQKYNAAAALGWTVFRLTAGMARDEAELSQIARLIRERAP